MTGTAAYLVLPAWGWIFTAALMALLWLRQRATRNATSVDVAWAACLGMLAAFYAIAGHGEPGRRVLIAVVALAWSARLALHLIRNRVMGHAEEDGRYAALRARWGARSDRNFFILYQAQALLAVILSVPFLLAAMNRGRFPALAEYAGVLLLGVAIAGESLADRQLARHRADPTLRRVTCRTGLWGVSRHPNYFFEWLAWCAFALIALMAPGGWIALAAPALMLLLILKVTGIPPTEDQAIASRGEDYRRYQREVSAFVPWPRRAPRRKSVREVL